MRVGDFTKGAAARAEAGIIASSQGRARLTPRPRNTVRREIGKLISTFPQAVASERTARIMRLSNFAVFQMKPRKVRSVPPPRAETQPYYRARRPNRSAPKSEGEPQLPPR